MASERPSAAGEVPSATPDTTSQASAKLKRRRVKREGPPQLQFLIATDPSQFRDEDAKRSVRSQAMIHWRHEEDKKKRKGSQKDDSTPTSSGKGTVRDTSARSECTSSIPTRTRQTQSVQSWSEPAELQHEQLQHASSRKGSNLLGMSSDSSPFVDTGSSRWQLTATETASYFPQYQNKTRAITEKAVIDYEESERHEERQLRTMIVGLATFYNIGGSHDPFDVLPQFRNPYLDALYLSRNCMRAFASDSTMKKWLPLMLSHPHIILSSTVLASTWLDMHNKCSGDSTTTVMVKAETISMINERLANPTLQLDDATLIVILHLFAGEMWVCNEKALRIHENGVATFVSRHGGLSSFIYNRALAEVAIACCYHCDIFCEAEMLAPFREGLPANSDLIDSETALPESPLYCPRDAFLTISDDAQCSQSTLELLCDMKELTNIFVAHNIALNTIHNTDAADITRLGLPNDAYEATIQNIRTRVTLLPSAHTPDVPVSGDWVYEACRIAALIYTTAIAMGIPFSVAADPNYVNFFETPMSFAIWDSDEQLPKPHLTEALYETLQRANTSNVWKNMSGVLYWVGAVGAAAARIPSTMNMAQQDRPGPEAYSVWVRRCLIMTATRTMIVLVFEHPTAIITAQKTLLKVQELIGSHASRRLET
ncbi:hypothetical protein BU25DRAFT_380373 [Macroventuria anomochaeta]|uniref:Uncharacterized protein n=1 Tax=Macroventuria anomochaeta TaxID=301207 RepID=A0ACB6SJ35_9PLEO|nr:uncharacterized protein BU25DRAFT_380373 [Macroventuria anomochaeta]KAF2633202.1 hypothetical protein BU25DRAFT_380373 [Macroventuria anomochaeta]